MNPLAMGKLPPDLLKKLLRHTSRSPLIAIGAGPGEDAAVASGAETIVLTADPVTFAGARLGAYVVAVNANDIVAMGGTPVYLTTTLLLAPGADAAEVESIFADIAEACARNGLLWVGGHTEVTPAVTRTVVCGQAIGFLYGRAPLHGRRTPRRLPVHDKIGRPGRVHRDRPRATRGRAGGPWAPGASGSAGLAG